jgi:hypothetical protein
MSHYVAYLNTVYQHRRVEGEVENVQDARHNAAMMLDTKREDAIHLYTYEEESKHSLADLVADTEKE